MRDWYNLVLEKKKKEEFLEKYSNYDFDSLEKIAKHGSLEKFRLLCNVLDYNIFEFDMQNKLRKLCNERIPNILGELSPIFETFRTSQTHEFWGGDERYKLFGYDFPPYAERKIIKSTLVFYIKYLKEPLEVKNLSNISTLYKNGLYWDLIKEPSSINVDFQNDDNEFNRLNRSRKEHVETWIKFMNFIWEYKYNEAYDFMCDLALKYNMNIGTDYM